MRTQRLFLASFLILTSLILGCQNPATKVDTFNKGVLVANALVTETSLTAETLYKGNKISIADATKYNEQLRGFAKGIDSAVQIHKTNPLAGEDALAKVSSALQVLIAYLETRK